MFILIKLEIIQNIRNMSSIGYFIGSYLALFSLFGIFFDISIVHHWIIQLISTVIFLMNYWQTRDRTIFFEYSSSPLTLFLIKTISRVVIHSLALSLVSIFYLPMPIMQFLLFLLLLILLQFILDPMISILSIISNESYNNILIWLLLIPFAVSPICLVNLCWQQINLYYVPLAAFAWLLMLIIITYSLIPLMFSKIVKFC